MDNLFAMALLLISKIGCLKSAKTFCGVFSKDVLDNSSLGTSTSVVDEFIQTEDITTVSQIDVFKNFQGLDSGSRLMSPKIQSLVGAFGLNEKLQCIRELYNGSSDAFNQAIEKVDNQSDFVSAKEVLSQHAIENSWDLESNLVNEFLQKVERRFL